jgi:hypothetical protein
VNPVLDYVEVIIGLILTLTMSIVLGLLFGSPGSYLGFLIATLIVGYQSRENLANGALLGTVCAVLAGVVFMAAMAIMTFLTGTGPGESMMEMGVLGIIIGLMVDGLIGSVGGALGTLLWAKNI